VFACPTCHSRERLLHTFLHCPCPVKQKEEGQRVRDVEELFLSLRLPPLRELRVSAVKSQLSTAHRQPMNTPSTVHRQSIDIPPPPVDSHHPAVLRFIQKTNHETNQRKTSGPPAAAGARHVPGRSSPDLTIEPPSPPNPPTPISLSCFGTSSSGAWTWHLEPGISPRHPTTTFSNSTTIHSNRLVTFSNP
jgi:hypothetical protein